MKALTIAVVAFRLAGKRQHDVLAACRLGDRAMNTTRYIVSFCAFTLSFALPLSVECKDNAVTYGVLSGLQKAMPVIIDSYNRGLQERKERELDSIQRNYANAERYNQQQLQIAQQEQAERDSRTAAQMSLAQQYLALKAQIVQEAGNDYTNYTTAQLARLRNGLLALRKQKPTRADYDPGQPSPQTWYVGRTRFRRKSRWYWYSLV